MVGEYKKYIEDIAKKTGFIKSTLEKVEIFKKFYDKFQKGIYRPELLFYDDEIIQRINKHPMIMWKINNK